MHFLQHGHHLDKLQEKLTRELMEVEVKTNNGIQELLTTLQRKEEEIYESQVNIDNIKKYAPSYHWAEYNILLHHYDWF
jgi:hypothetical protein